MLYLTIEQTEMFNENTNEFIKINSRKIALEHSLVSISKWESKWKKPFLDDGKSSEEIIDYIRCMTITQNVDPNIYYCLTKKNIEDIKKYIEDEHSATKIYDLSENKTEKKTTITSELIYYWMLVYNIPFECQKWNLNRLLVLINICNIKNNPKKMPNREIQNNFYRLNEARLSKMKTRG